MQLRKKKLQNAFNNIEKYYKKWKIKINIAKTQTTFFPFNKSPKRVPSANLTTNNNEIAYSNIVKYLGVHLDKKLLYKDHIQLSITKAHKILGSLYTLLYFKSKLNLKNKRMIYFTVIRPVMLYACPVWYNASKCHLKKLQILQNKCLKIIYNLPNRFSTNRLHEENHTKPIKDVIEDQTSSFLEKCRRSEYDHIRRLADNLS